MLRSLSAVFIYSSLLLFADIDYKANASCTQGKGEVYSVLSAKIMASEDATINTISCEEIGMINEYNIDELLITSGRKRGKYTICISNDPSNPCKHILGNLKVNQNPSDSLVSVFEIEKPKQKFLNETVERLFFKPSLLID